MSSMYLPTSPLSSPPYLRHISPGTRKDGSDGDLRFDLPTNFQGGIADPYFAGELLPIPPRTSLSPLYYPRSPHISPYLP